MSNNFTVKAEKALNRSVKLAEELGHTYIGTEHVLLALAEDETCCASILMKKNRISADDIFCAIKEYSGVGTITQLSSKDTTPKCRKLLESSYKISKKYMSERIGTEHLLLGILSEKECVATKILTKIEADIVALRESIVGFMRTSGRDVVVAEPVAETSIPNLLKYGKNITAMAERGELDPVVGRDRETDRVIRILSRRNKNNPCLIGEAGVGKTAVVEGLASRIAEGRVPDLLLGKIIISLDLTSMVAGAKYRGDFEERIKNIMNEVEKNKAIILFIDEIHTIVGAGSAEGAVDAANIMKPELSRGDIQIIGATTLSEYRKYIEKDSALERRFQPVMIEEPSIEATIDILMGLKPKLEAHHKVVIEDSAIYSAVRLSDRYINDRYLPDKAIDVLDEACALVGSTKVAENDKIKEMKEKIRQTSLKKKSAINVKDYELALNLRELENVYENELKNLSNFVRENYISSTIKESDVRTIVEEITGVILRVESSHDNIYDRLSKSVVGQDDAVMKLSSAVTRSFAGVNSPDRPRGVFLFLGESGVGKTRLAAALTKELFGSTESLIRYDMSEYSEGASVTKLLGASPGYVGYDDNNSPIEKIRKRPYSVVLLDEIEKANPEVLSLFLQVFDNGFLTDGTGRRISFRNCYIIMTSNACADRIGKNKSLGFVSDRGTEDIYNEIKGVFKDEFINRIDEIILFSPLDEGALSGIAKIKVEELVDRLASIEIKLEVDESVYGAIVELLKTQSGSGARPIERIIVSAIENNLAKMIVDGVANKGDVISVTSEDNNIICRKKSYAIK